MHAFSILIPPPVGVDLAEKYRSGHSWSRMGVHLVHRSGDAAHLNTLRRLLTTFKCEAAIVMGTIAGPKFPGQSISKPHFWKNKLDFRSFQISDSPSSAVSTPSDYNVDIR